jgi:uncharacterized protein
MIETKRVENVMSQTTITAATISGPVTVRPAVLSQTQLTELLDDLVQRIREVSAPERIILFGSYARGNARPGSDIDLLVIKDKVDSPRAETGRIYRALGHLSAPVDVVVADTAYVQRYGALVGTVIRPALREGRVLYVR